MEAGGQNLNVSIWVSFSVDFCMGDSFLESKLRYSNSLDLEAQFEAKNGGRRPKSQCFNMGVFFYGFWHGKLIFGIEMEVRSIFQSRSHIGRPKMKASGLNIK